MRFGISKEIWRKIRNFDVEQIKGKMSSFGSIFPLLFSIFFSQRRYEEKKFVVHRSSCLLLFSEIFVLLNSNQLFVMMVVLALFKPLPETVRVESPALSVLWRTMTS